MSNQATCPACNTQLRSASPLPPGSTIKCPKCGHIFRVGQAAGSPHGTGGDVAAPGIAGPRAAPAAGPPPPKKRSKLWLILLLISGGVLALCICSCGGIFLILQNTGDKTLVGTWELDKSTSSSASVEKEKFSYELTGGVIRRATFTEAGKTRRGTWSVANEAGKEVILFAEEGSLSVQRYEFERIDADHIKIVSVEPTSGLPTPSVLKRVGSGSGEGK